MVLEFPYPLSITDFDRLEPWAKSLSESSLSDTDDLVLNTRHGGLALSVCDAHVSMIDLLTKSEYDENSHRDVLSLDLGRGLFLGFSHVYEPRVKVGDSVVLGTVIGSQDPHFGVTNDEGYNHFHFGFYRLICGKRVGQKVRLTGPQRTA